MGSYRFLEHATDAIIETKGADMADSFVAAADATVHLTLDKSTVKETGHETIEARGENLQHLLFSWLEEVVYVLITKGFAIRRIVIEETVPPEMRPEHTGALYVRARAYGEPIDLGRHGFKVEIKAPTFYEMQIKRHPDTGITSMRFLLDL